MKKFLTLLLALSLVACMSLSVSAETVTFDNDDTDAFKAGNLTSSSAVSINLKESTAGTDAGIVYKVDVTWAGTNLEYTIENGEDVMVWNPNNHTYEVKNGEEGVQDVQGSWTKDTVTATVVNHSNTAIEATLTGLAGTNGVSFTAPNGDNVTLPSAAEGDSLGNVGAAPSFAFEIKPTPTSIPTSDFTINFTITLRDAG